MRRALVHLRRAWWAGTGDRRAGVRRLPLRRPTDVVPMFCTLTFAALLAIALAYLVAGACAAAVIASGVVALRFGAWLQRIDDADSEVGR